MAAGNTSSKPPIAEIPEASFSELTALLKNLVDAEKADERGRLEIRPFDANRLVQVRLGIASGLFTALRHKDPRTAQHSLRVALCCSSWAAWLQLGPELHDALELAALLHDIGKMGVPDAVLRKPGPLDSSEVAIMEAHRAAGVEILTSCCARPEVREIVTHASAWYDGSRPGKGPSGADIPFGARMLGIVDAFDAMLSAQVYRRALPRERALLELQRQAGRQFDPELVRRYTEFQDSELAKLPSDVARQWLTTLDPETVNAAWRHHVEAPRATADRQSLYRRKLLENMHDAVVFVDGSLRIVGWNAGAERLTGIAGPTALERNWLPSIVELRDEQGRALPDADCPVAYCIRSHVRSWRRMSVRGREQAQIAVDAHAIPVLADDGGVQGAVFMLRDVSRQTSLEERCHDLHALATKDPLTGLANRAEFDRVLATFVAAHVERRQPCSLMICDIDHFKTVNDGYGHQAGDAVIQSFAKLLMGECHSGDLAARYGGEEFVLLCAGCDTATATRRAEKLRSGFARIPQEVLGGVAVTASFGVTSIQAGDTPETMLRRADRALLSAKDGGRNQVVQLGTGAELEESAAWRPRWLRRKSKKSSEFFVQHLATDAPFPVTVEKLRGFIADHHAEVVSINSSVVHIHLDGDVTQASRRLSDRPLKFLMELQFTCAASAVIGPADATTTRIRAAVNTQRSRDRRRSDVAERARRLLVSLRAYLMAVVDDEEINEADERRVFRLARNLLLPLWGRRAD